MFEDLDVSTLLDGGDVMRYDLYIYITEHLSEISGEINTDDVLGEINSTCFEECSILFALCQMRLIALHCTPFHTIANPASFGRREHLSK